MASSIAVTGTLRSSPISSSSSSVRLGSSSSYSSSSVSVVRCVQNGWKGVSCRRNGEKSSFGVCRAQQTMQGTSANYAKEMERLSAKESLLLAFKDSGGFESLITGKTTDVQRIDVNERITGLERLNPTPRPTTSPFLEGRWNYQWLGSGNPIFGASTLLFGSFPATLASFLAMDVVIKDGYTTASANLKFLSSIESTFILVTKLTVEGPLRMKEESVEGVLKGAVGQAVATFQQLPESIRDMASNGLKISLNGAFQRLYMISYLDEEILVLRDSSGVPEVLTRLDDPPSLTMLEPITEYES